MRPTPRERTAAEAITVGRFQRATQAAKHAPPEMIARYDERARQENKSKFSIRTRDYMVPPKIIAVYLVGYTGQPDQDILIWARDDFEVKDVTVTLRSANGVVLESGAAARAIGDIFRYVSQTRLPTGTDATVEIVATDWPKNATTWTSTITCPVEPKESTTPGSAEADARLNSEAIKP